MHLANASAESPCAVELEPDVEAPPTETELLVVVATLATDGAFEPPQLVSATAAAARSANPPNLHNVVALIVASRSDIRAQPRKRQVTAP
jgi:hypothetical protein